MFGIGADGIYGLWSHSAHTGKEKEVAAGEMITFQTPVCACFPFSPPFPTLVW